MPRHEYRRAVGARADVAALRHAQHRIGDLGTAPTDTVGAGLQDEEHGDAGVSLLPSRHLGGNRWSDFALSSVAAVAAGRRSGRPAEARPAPAERTKGRREPVRQMPADWPTVMVEDWAASAATCDAFARRFRGQRRPPEPASGRSCGCRSRRRRITRRRLRASDRYPMPAWAWATRRWPAARDWAADVPFSRAARRACAATIARRGIWRTRLSLAPQGARVCLGVRWCDSRLVLGGLWLRCCVGLRVLPREVLRPFAPLLLGRPRSERRASWLQTPPCPPRLVRISSASRCARASISASSALRCSVTRLGIFGSPALGLGSFALGLGLVLLGAVLGPPSPCVRPLCSCARLPSSWSPPCPLVRPSWPPPVTRPLLLRVAGFGQPPSVLPANFSAILCAAASLAVRRPGHQQARRYQRNDPACNSPLQTLLLPYAIHAGAKRKRTGSASGQGEMRIALARPQIEQSCPPLRRKAGSLAERCLNERSGCS